jgi:hypothetical protein
MENKFSYDPINNHILRTDDNSHFLGTVIHKDGGLGIGAHGLTKSEIAEAFALYHERIDPNLPLNWEKTISGRIKPIMTCFDIDASTIDELERVIEWIRRNIEK